MTEVWKPIKENPLYFCSNLGNMKRGNNLLIPTNGGGKTYRIIVNGKRMVYSIVKIMREYFPYEWIKYLQDDEEVKKIKGYSGYFITTKGRVWSLWSNDWVKSHRTKLKDRENYYESIGLSGDTRHIHTIVGRNFLSDYKEGKIIMHKDETLPFPEVSYLENLKVGDLSDNMKDMWDKGRHYTPQRNKKGQFCTGGKL